MSGDFTLGGDDADEEDTLGWGLWSPELFRVTLDCRLADLDWAIC